MEDMNFQHHNGFFSYPPSTPPPTSGPPPLPPSPPPSFVPFINYFVPPAARSIRTTWTLPPPPPPIDVAATAPIRTTWTPPPPAAPMRTWTERDNMMFMEALAQIPDGTPCRWEMIAHRVPEKSPQEVEAHFRRLRRIVNNALPKQYRTWHQGSTHMQPAAIPTNGAADGSLVINDGVIPQPVASDRSLVVHGEVIPQPVQSSDATTASSSSTNNQNRSWSIEEHKLFLRGLEEYGKGRWTAISNYVVKTKTPTQVASHAQKFFLRQQSRNSNKESRRRSIHDIVR